MRSRTYPGVGPSRRTLIPYDEVEATSSEPRRGTNFRFPSAARGTIGHRIRPSELGTHTASLPEAASCQAMEAMQTARGPLRMAVLVAPTPTKCPHIGSDGAVQRLVPRGGGSDSSRSNIVVQPGNAPWVGVKPQGPARRGARQERQRLREAREADSCFPFWTVGAPASPENRTRTEMVAQVRGLTIGIPTR